MATEDVVADLPSPSQCTFRSLAVDSIPEDAASKHATALGLASEAVRHTVTRSRVFDTLDDVAANASFIKQAQAVAADPAKASLMIPVLEFYEDAYHRSNIDLPPFVAAFAVELFRLHRNIGAHLFEHDFTLYNRLANALYSIVMAGTQPYASRQ